MKPNKPELKHLGLDVLQPIARELLDTDYLHYGYWKDIEVTFPNICKAQKFYVEFLIENIPDSVQSILDVGSGSGEVAKVLIEKKGYRIDCVSPSEALNQIARKKLENSSKVFTSFFQDFRSEKKYDLIFFSESFQYVPVGLVFQSALPLLNKNGYLLICDFFKLKSSEKSPIGGGHDLDCFYQTLKKSSFQTLKDLDITDETSPTIDLRDRFMKKIVLPIGEAGQTHLQIRYPLVLKLIKKVFKKQFQKFNRKYIEQSINAAVFKKHKSYRLILLQKK